MNELIQIGREEGNFKKAIHLVGKCFSDASVLQQSFYNANTSFPMIAISEVLELYQLITEVEELKNPLGYALWNLATSHSNGPSFSNFGESVPLLVGVVAPIFFCEQDQYVKIIGL